MPPTTTGWSKELPGTATSSLRLVCDLYLGQIIYVPIWDDFQLITKKPNGNNAVFHIIGFAAFRLDGVIDNKNNGDPSNDACGDGLDLGGKPNDKGFVGTYVDSFVGTQVAPCIPSADGVQPLPEPAERPSGDQPRGLASPRTTRPLQRREDQCLGRGKTEALPRP